MASPFVSFFSGYIVCLGFFGGYVLYTYFMNSTVPEKNAAEINDDDLGNTMAYLFL